jgi:DNA-binding CsgD family transcriptional regulator/pimeloyl-ACP methyl ester carboxylesterase
MDAPPVQYATTSDDFSIAYGVSGEGTPLVFTPASGFSNVQLVWRFYPDWLPGLASRFELVQYDHRGHGLSTRRLNEGVSFDHFLLDMETVIERLHLEKFILWGWGYLAHVAARYALAHGDHVEALILHTCAAANSAWDLPELKTANNWEHMLHSLASLNSAGMTREEQSRLVKDYRSCWTMDEYLSTRDAFMRSDLTEELPLLRIPTLVLHQREHYMLAPEEGMRLASLIPSARFALLDTFNLYGDAAQGLAAIDQFLATLPPTRVKPSTVQPGLDSRLSAREIEVLRLIAAGRSNQEIADALVISINTVNRHVSNIFDKTGAANRAQAAVYAKEQGLA